MSSLPLPAATLPAHLRLVPPMLGSSPYPNLSSSTLSTNNTSLRVCRPLFPLYPPSLPESWPPYRETTSTILSTVSSPVWRCMLRTSVIYYGIRPTLSIIKVRAFLPPKHTPVDVGVVGTYVPTERGPTTRLRILPACSPERVLSSKASSNPPSPAIPPRIRLRPSCVAALLHSLRHVSRLLAAPAAPSTDYSTRTPARDVPCHYAPTPHVAGCAARLRRRPKRAISFSTLCHTHTLNNTPPHTFAPSRATTRTRSSMRRWRSWQTPPPSRPRAPRHSSAHPTPLCPANHDAHTQDRTLQPRRLHRLARHCAVALLSVVYSTTRSASTCRRHSRSSAARSLPPRAPRPSAAAYPPQCAVRAPSRISNTAQQLRRPFCVADPTDSASPHATAFLSAATRSAVALRALRIARCDISPPFAAASRSMPHARHDPIAQHHPHAQHARRPLTIPGAVSLTLPLISTAFALTRLTAAPVAHQHPHAHRDPSPHRRLHRPRTLPPFPAVLGANTGLRAGSARRSPRLRARPEIRQKSYCFWPAEAAAETIGLRGDFRQAGSASETWYFSVVPSQNADQSSLGRGAPETVFLGSLWGFRMSTNPEQQGTQRPNRRNPRRRLPQQYLMFQLRQKLMESMLTIVNQTLQFNHSEPLKLNELIKSGWRLGVDCAPTTN
ncbi:hypothetical protein FB451DRAFT_1508599 [Mycena latifolia]|nr:hypothetical protein FB451DRAFT_1508599 [Mycena latifolia]